MVSVTEELILKLYVILITLNMYSHRKLVAIVLGSTGLESGGSKH